MSLLSTPIKEEYRMISRTGFYTMPRYLYVLFDSVNKTHYGFTTDYQQAMIQAKLMEDDPKKHVEIYEIDLAYDNIDDEE
jgi:hypothetical protein